MSVVHMWKANAGNDSGQVVHTNMCLCQQALFDTSSDALQLVW